MKAYVHSKSIRPDGTKDSFITQREEWRLQPRTGRLQVMWNGRWKNVHVRHSTSPFDGRSIEHHYFRFHAGSGIEASIQFVED